MAETPLVLADSSLWIAANRSDAPGVLKEHFKQLMLEERLATAPYIRLEILCGARTPAAAEELEKVFEPLRNLPVTEAVWDRACRLGARARQKGLPRLAPDVLIAAVALVHRALLWHCDRDFDRLKKVEPELKTYQPA